MADKCNCGNNCKCGFEIKESEYLEGNFEYNIFDGEGKVFLTGDGFESYDEAFNWLVDLGHYIGRGIDKLSHSSKE